MNNGPTISFGMIGHHVRRLQRILVAQKLINPSSLTGIFNTQTRSVVKEIQHEGGLAQTGIVNNATWHLLPPDVQTKTLARGMTGAKVRALQEALTLIALDGADPGGIDGSFGERTEAAVYAYQKYQGIVTDGIVGDQTWWVPAGAAGATLASLSGLA